MNLFFMDLHFGYRMAGFKSLQFKPESYKSRFIQAMRRPHKIANILMLSNLLILLPSRW